MHTPPSFTPAPTPTPTPEMPRHDHDNQVLCAVLAEHGITHDEVAQATGISRPFLSRVFAGQYAVPPAVLRYLWARTKDHRVLRVALGDRALDQLIERAHDQRLALVFQTSTTIGQVSDGLARVATGAGNPAALCSHMATLTRHMQQLSSHLLTAQQIPHVDLTGRDLGKQGKAWSA